MVYLDNACKADVAFPKNWKQIIHFLFNHLVT